MRYGIMGGTFDPIHLGHLFIAEDIRDKLNLEKIVFIPNGTPPHKRAKTPDSLRYQMTEAAIEGNERFEISDMEIAKKGYAYTIDTLKALKAQDEDSEIYFLVGGDSIVNFHKWKSYREIFDYCTIVCYSRSSFNTDEVQLEDELYSQIIFTDSIKLDISSTLIRERVRKGRSIKYIVPEKIEQFIRENGLYRENNNIDGD